jgi:hypothetical protein
VIESARKSEARKAWIIALVVLFLLSALAASLVFVTWIFHPTCRRQRI